MNVRVGGGAQQRPQWFGHRPSKGPHHEHDDDDEEESHEHEGPHGGRPRPPRPETNGTKYD